MGLEASFTYITSLDSANPVGATDLKSEGDEHIRGIKTVLLATFPNLNAEVGCTPAELNYLDGSTPGTAVNSKALVVDSSGNLDFNANQLDNIHHLGVGTSTPASGGFLFVRGDSSEGIPVARFESDGAFITGSMMDIEIRAQAPGIVFRDKSPTPDHDWRIGTNQNILAISADTDEDDARTGGNHFDDVPGILTFNTSGAIGGSCINTDLEASAPSTQIASAASIVSYVQNHADYILHMRESRTAGTAASAVTAGAWTARILSATVVNNITGASRTGNTFDLPAGTYKIEVMAQFWSAGQVKLRLRNTTDSTTDVVGMVSESRISTETSACALMQGRFVIAGTKTFQIEYYCTDNGFGGVRVNDGSEVEIYHDVFITKLK